MKKLFLAPLFAALMVAVSAAQTPAPDYVALQTTSCMVRATGGNGTGVLVTRQVGSATRTYVWTAAHVVSDNRQPDGTFTTVKIIQEFRTEGKLTGRSEVGARVIRYSSSEGGEDLALLEIDQPDFRPLTVSAKFYRGAVLAVGTPLVHIGCVRGLYNSASEGIVSQTDRKFDGKVFDQTTVMGYPGSSGGGVYLRDGRCMGLLVQGVGPGLNFVVPIRRMETWAKAQNLEWAIDPNAVMPSSLPNTVDVTPRPVSVASPTASLEVTFQSIKRLVRRLVL
jgi:S1-C subfamily serine protease